jgi:transcriptional regulator with XRE-family HTH domain
LDLAAATTATHSEILDRFAARVRLARLVAGYTSQRELAEVLAVHHSAVSNWERGLQFAKVTDLYALAKALGVTIDWLVAGDEAGLTVDRRRLLARADV